MGGLRLARLPDRTPVKITIAVPPDLHQALADYAELYRETYGQQEPVQDLIPAMLSSFLEGDKAFARRPSRAGRLTSMSDLRSNAIGSAAMITVEELAQLARLSRRQVDRLRRRRPPGFPREYEMGERGQQIPPLFPVQARGGPEVVGFESAVVREFPRAGELRERAASRPDRSFNQ